MALLTLEQADNLYSPLQYSRAYHPDLHRVVVHSLAGGNVQGLVRYVGGTIVYSIASNHVDVFPVANVSKLDAMLDVNDDPVIAWLSGINLYVRYCTDTALQIYETVLCATSVLGFTLCPADPEGISTPMDSSIGILTFQVGNAIRQLTLSNQFAAPFSLVHTVAATWLLYQAGMNQELRMQYSFQERNGRLNDLLSTSEYIITCGESEVLTTLENNSIGLVTS